MKPLPDNILRRMAPADRKPMGKAGQTGDEASAQCAAGQERKLQALINNWLRLNGFMFIQSRTDKKTRTAAGVPDFVIFAPNGKTLLAECKSGTGRLTDEQEKWLGEAAKLGHHCAVIRSLPELIEQLRKL